jgi:hypothetical protein
VVIDIVIVALLAVLLKRDTASPGEKTPLGTTMLPPDPIVTNSPTSDTDNV